MNIYVEYLMREYRDFGYARFLLCLAKSNIKQIDVAVSMSSKLEPLVQLGVMRKQYQIL